AEEAFKQMKQLIAELPMLTAPMEKEELIAYLAATKEIVSAVLMTKWEAKQMPIYFVSRALRGLELNYTLMENFVLALVHASKHLKRPIISVKRHILADFIVERTEEGSPDTPMEEVVELPEPWILFTDWSSCTDGSGAGLILTNLEGMGFTYALRFRFDATNKEAEFEALIFGLRIAEQMGVKNLQANVDLQLVANQVNETYVAKEADMIRYLEKLLVNELKEKSISEIEILAVVEEEGDTWMTPLFKYITEGTLPSDVKKARAIKQKSWRFTVVSETLYKNSFSGTMAKMRLDSLEKLSQIMEYSSGTIPSKIGAKNYLRRRNKGKVGCKKKELDRRATPCSMGTPHNDQIKQWGYPVLKNIQNGGGHPSRNRHAYTQNSISRYGDLVYRNNDASRAKDTGKLSLEFFQVLARIRFYTAKTIRRHDPDCGLLDLTVYYSNPSFRDFAAQTAWEY
nr:hypothetical protein [Tanacetum cinerariifolium]